MKIIYTCNDSYFDCLFLSILSIVRRCNKKINFYILSADYKELNRSYDLVSTKHIDILQNLVKKYNSENTVKLIDCTKQAKSLLTNEKNVNRKHFSPYASLRLLIHIFPELSGKVIYLDTDIMACGNIEELYNIDISGYEMAVCHNWWLRRTIAKNIFNNGVMLLNMETIKETKLFEKGIVWFNQHFHKWSDQMCLVKNVTKLKYFPGDEFRFNRQSEQIRQGDIIKHFCNRPLGWPFWNNIKQSDIKNVHKHLKIFEFDKDYEIWLLEKEKWRN